MLAEGWVLADRRPGRRDRPRSPWVPPPLFCSTAVVPPRWIGWVGATLEDGHVPPLLGIGLLPLRGDDLLKGRADFVIRVEALAGRRLVGGQLPAVPLGKFG
jgi:hypothetical protein